MADPEDTITRLSRLPTVMTAEMVVNLREGMARLEGKLDAALALRTDFETFKAASNERLIKIEAWQGFASIIGGGVWALTLVVVGAAFIFIK